MNLFGLLYKVAHFVLIPSNEPGPQHPVLSSRPTIAPGQNNVLTGFAVQDHIDKFSFEEQLNSFNNNGFAVSPTGNFFIGTPDSNKREKRKRKPFGEAGDLSDFSGPWAPFEDEESIKLHFKQLTDTATEDMTSAVNEKNEERLAFQEEAAKAVEEEEDKDNKKPKKEKEIIQAKSVFHGTELRDYLGRSYVDPPSHIKPAPHHCFLPKKLIHTWYFIYIYVCTFYLYLFKGLAILKELIQ
jgi:pre-mRNA-processing factor 17